MESKIRQNKMYISKIFLTILLIASTIMALIYCAQKRGYYVDEGMTFVLSNGQYNGAVTSRPEGDFGDFLDKYVLKNSFSETLSNVYEMLKETKGAGNYSEEGKVDWYDEGRKLLQGSSTWITGQELRNQIVAESGQRFDYGQVYMNQVVDVHPPLYYFFVHTIFSLFHGEYSDLLLSGLNIVFLLSTAILLFRLISSRTKRKVLAFMALILFSFSQGYFSCSVYYRMYAMLTFWMMLTFYILIEAKDRNWELKRSQWFTWGLVVFCGFLTHYYFVFYVILLFIVSIIKLIRRREKVAVKKYTLTMVLAGVAGLMVWPAAIYHVFFGYRGKETIANITRMPFIGRFKQLLDSFCNALFLGNYVLMTGVVLLGLIIVIAFLIRKRAGSGKDMAEDNPVKTWLKNNVAELIIPVIVYSFFVVSTAPEVSMRYFYCLMPFICILIAYILFGGCSVFDFSKLKINKYQQYLGLLITIIWSILSLIITKPEYLYTDNANPLNFDEISKENTKLLMIEVNAGAAFPYILDMADYSEVMVTTTDNLAEIQNKKPSEEKDMLVYIDPYVEESILDNVVEYMGLEKPCKEVYSGPEGRVYYFKSQLN